MTLIIVLMLLFSYLLIATGHLTGVNKAAIATFLGTISWVVFVIWSKDFSQEVFLGYVGRAAAIVMFLLATMSIIEILNNN